MRSISIVLAGMLCAAASAFAQTSVDRAFESSPRECADVRWSQSTLDAIPSIASACQAVEQRNGKSYVKLSGEVQEVASGGRRVIVDFDDGGELAFTPSAHTRLYLDGKRTDFEDLRSGTELNFYIPEDRLQAELQPDIERAFFVVFPLQLNPGERVAGDARGPGQSARSGSPGHSADELPATASLWPTVGLIGVLLLVLAAGLTLRRRLTP